MNLPPQLETKFQTLETRYPVKRSALIPMLLYAQDQFGYLSDDILAEIARRLDLNTVQVVETMSYFRCCAAHAPENSTSRFAPTFPACSAAEIKFTILCRKN